MIPNLNEFCNDLSVDLNSGYGYSSKRGLARMCGISQGTWGKGKNIMFTKEIDLFVLEELEIISDRRLTRPTLEILIEHGFVVVDKNSFKIMDVVCSIVVSYYAYVKRIETARKVNRYLNAVGMRTLIQTACGYRPNPFGNLYLDSPRRWSKMFPDQFYDQLARITGLTWDKETHHKPRVFAKLTNELVYQYLPEEVYQTIKSTQKKHGGDMHRLHQFLNEDGLDALKNQLTLVMLALEMSSDIETARQGLHQRLTGQYQQNLLVPKVPKNLN